MRIGPRAVAALAGAGGEPARMALATLAGALGLLARGDVGRPTGQAWLVGLLLLAVWEWVARNHAASLGAASLRGRTAFAVTDAGLEVACRDGDTVRAFQPTALRRGPLGPRIRSASGEWIVVPRAAFRDAGHRAAFEGAVRGLVLRSEAPGNRQRPRATLVGEFVHAATLGTLFLVLPAAVAATLWASAAQDGATLEDRAAAAYAVGSRTLVFTLALATLLAPAVALGRNRRALAASGEAEPDTVEAQVRDDGSLDLRSRNARDVLRPSQIQSVERTAGGLRLRLRPEPGYVTAFDLPLADADAGWLAQAIGAPGGRASGDSS